MSIKNLPDGFKEMLKTFTIAVLQQKPKNVVRFAAEYFKRLSGKEVDKDSSSDMDTDEFSDPQITMPERVGVRRKSVAAERYDPEEDDDDEYVKPCFPKTDKQRQILKKICNHVILFDSLDEDQMDDVINAMFRKEVSPGDKIIVQGDDGDNFYVIVAGNFDVIINKKKVLEYNDSGSFGELALMYNAPRAATVEATTKGELYAMDRETFRCIVLKSAYQRRQEFGALLESVTILKSLSANERLALCDSLTTRTYFNNDLIIKQGEAGMEMFFIVTGVVRLSMREYSGKPEVEISRLSKGAYFGELALITRKPRAASAYAVGKVRLAVLEVTCFERLLGPCLDVMKRNINHYKHQIDEIFHNMN